MQQSSGSQGSGGGRPSSLNVEEYIRGSQAVTQVDGIVKAVEFGRADFDGGRVLVPGIGKAGFEATANQAFGLDVPQATSDSHVIISRVPGRAGDGMLSDALPTLNHSQLDVVDKDLKMFQELDRAYRQHLQDQLIIEHQRAAMQVDATKPRRAEHAARKLQRRRAREE